jgi:hypothetical protein
MQNKTVQTKKTAPIKAHYLHYKGYPLHLRAGLRAVFLPAGSNSRWVLDEFPEDLFPRGSILLHDAEHYGIEIQVEQISFPHLIDFGC